MYWIQHYTVDLLLLLAVSDIQVFQYYMISGGNLMQIYNHRAKDPYLIQSRIMSWIGSRGRGRLGCQNRCRLN